MMKENCVCISLPRVLNLVISTSLAAAIHVETPVRMHDDFD